MNRVKSVASLMESYIFIRRGPKKVNGKVVGILLGLLAFGFIAQNLHFLIIPHYHNHAHGLAHEPSNPHANASDVLEEPHSGGHAQVCSLQYVPERKKALQAAPASSRAVFLKWVSETARVQSSVVQWRVYQIAPKNSPPRTV